MPCNPLSWERLFSILEKGKVEHCFTRKKEILVVIKNHKPRIIRRTITPDCIDPAYGEASLNPVRQ